MSVCETSGSWPGQHSADVPAGDLLRVEAEGFAERLTTLLNRTVTTDADVTVRVQEEPPFATVAAGHAEKLKELGLVPLSTARSAQERQQAPLWLKVSFSVGLDDEGKHLAVQTSIFGLCINPKTAHCPLRIEFNRANTSRPQAHVHIHGESAGLGYAFALAGRPPKDIMELHLPVGGRRFRPTLEDFIELLADEKLARVKNTWRKAIEESRADWLERQTRAAVRRNPEAAIDQLRSMGYAVDPPGPGGDAP